MEAKDETRRSEQVDEFPAPAATNGTGRFRTRGGGQGRDTVPQAAWLGLVTILRHCHRLVILGRRHNGCRERAVLSTSSSSAADATAAANALSSPLRHPRTQAGDPCRDLATAVPLPDACRSPNELPGRDRRGMGPRPVAEDDEAEGPVPTRHFSLQGCGASGRSSISPHHCHAWSPPFASSSSAAATTPAANRRCPLHFVILGRRHKGLPRTRFLHRHPRAQRGDPCRDGLGRAMRWRMGHASGNGTAVARSRHGSPACGRG